jgi:hypothetical protein
MKTAFDARFLYMPSSPTAKPTGCSIKEQKNLPVKKSGNNVLN